ncbi:MAG: uracil phosphoribosyltransferase [Deltaproteobacteria bacterium]|mgnify:CR=1 FL=1|nr:MAG: uracil phosphoribosyltransferase [Deltaproteobacteria bacterium]
MSFTVVDHPLIRHKLGFLRRNDTSTSKFRDLAREVTSLLTYEAFRDMELEPYTVKGWAGPVKVEKLSGKKVAVVPILRAGIGMLQGVLDIIPSARVNVVGLYRNEETAEPVYYYHKLSSDVESRLAVIIDPMLATGNSMVAAVDLLKKAGCRDIRAICMVAAPEGVKCVEDAHPDVRVFAAALDDKLNEVKYILPGLGDAGDRLFGTK